ncbi:MAG: 4Fe-4S binding protein [Alphaproteobacteria bacterium]|nr:4Fe-4S binding protein [Alphaproteobacteria bacterium]
MAYKITENCVGCAGCAGACPFDAIKRKDDGKFEIDQSLCEKCGACVNTCPVDAIIAE